MKLCCQALAWTLLCVAAPRLHAEAETVVSHCKDQERVYFSCTFKNGKTASLCGSPDMDANHGVLQYRYGVKGKALELVFPDPKSEYHQLNDGKSMEPAKGWFHWSSRYFETLPSGVSFDTWNDRWHPGNLPKGMSVETYVWFSPLPDENPSIGFHIQSQVGPHIRERLHDTPGAWLSVWESGGPGRELMRLRCLPKQTHDELFFLKDALKETN